MRFPVTLPRRMVAVITVVTVLASMLAPPAYAIDPQDSRPYWTGYPSVLQECVGQVVTRNGYGLIPARSTYTETRYSSGGFCNNALQRPIGMIEATAQSFSQVGTLCDNQFRQNQSATAWNVIATAAACSSGTFVVQGISRYDNAAAGFPQRTVHAQ